MAEEETPLPWVCAPLWRVGGFPLPPPPTHEGVDRRDYRHALFRIKQLHPLSRCDSDELDESFSSPPLSSPEKQSPLHQKTPQLSLPDRFCWSHPEEEAAACRRHSDPGAFFISSTSLQLDCDTSSFTTASKPSSAANVCFCTKFTPLSKPASVLSKLPRAQSAPSCLYSRAPSLMSGGLRCDFCIPKSTSASSSNANEKPLTFDTNVDQLLHSSVPRTLLSGPSQLQKVLVEQPRSLLRHTEGSSTVTTEDVESSDSAYHHGSPSSQGQAHLQAGHHWHQHQDEHHPPHLRVPNPTEQQEQLLHGPALAQQDVPQSPGYSLAFSENIVRGFEGSCHDQQNGNQYGTTNYNLNSVKGTEPLSCELSGGGVPSLDSYDSGDVSLETVYEGTGSSLEGPCPVVTCSAREGKPLDPFGEISAEELWLADEDVDVQGKY